MRQTNGTRKGPGEKLVKDMTQTLKTGALAILIVGVFVTNASSAVPIDFQTHNTTVIIESPAPEVEEFSRHQPSKSGN